MAPPSERVILLVRTPADDEVMGRLRAELANGDWRIVELRVDERLGRAPLSQLARKEAVSAAARLDSVKGVVELWILRDSGDLEETIGNPGERTSASVLALGTTEALRARGLSRDRVAADVQEPVTPASQPVIIKPRRAKLSGRSSEPGLDHAKVERARPQRLWLELGPAATASPGGLDASFQALVGARFELAERWALGAFGLLPLTTQEVSGVEGSAAVSTFVVAGVSDLALLRTSIIEISSGIGLGATIASMRGVPARGYRAEDTSVVAATAFARGSFQVRLGELWRLSARVLVGGTLPQVSIRFEEREVATWGRPMVAATLGLEVPLTGATQAQ